MTPDLKVLPPDIEGYRFREHLGSGGYSEVFLYEDLRLGRDVAVKVLTQGGSDEEARVMALVATHTHIVDVYDVGVTELDFPYLVMQLYSGPTFAQRVRSGPLRLWEVLQLGVQLCGALEWAHRLGVLHRDIKPANILTTSAGRPGLSDFGISTSGGVKEKQTGFSLPWVPPEVLEGHPADELGDVYSLAATLFTLCEGHPPFVVMAGDNRDEALLARTLSQQPPPVTNADAPASLNSLMRSALSRQPDARPTSAAAFGRALQGIEAELRLAQTPLEVPTSAPTAVDRTNDAEATRVRGVRVINPDPVDQPTRARPDPAASLIPSPSHRSAHAFDGRRRTTGAPEQTALQGQSNAAGGESASAPAHDAARRAWFVGGAITLVAVVVVVASVAGRGESGARSDGRGDPFATPTTLAQPVAKVTDLTLERTGPDTVRASWTTPTGGAAVFAWRRCDAAGGVEPAKTDQTSVEIAGAAEGSSVCVAVTAERGAATSDEERATLP